MPSPFPGMDPFLEGERFWPWFHHQLALTLQQYLTGRISDRYSARISERHYRAERQERCEASIGIYTTNDDRLVTWLDFVSPANKLTAAGREAYLSTRRAVNEAGAHIVEVDLILRGKPTLDYPRDAFLPPHDYAVSVLVHKPVDTVRFQRAECPDFSCFLPINRTVSTGLCIRQFQPEQHEVYATTLEKRLARFRLPLGPDDLDTVVNLPEVFTRAYDDGGFRDEIDYYQAPVVQLNAEQRERIARLLQAPKQGLRGHAE